MYRLQVSILNFPSIEFNIKSTSIKRYMGNNFRKNTEAMGLKTLIISILLVCVSCGRESKTGTDIKNETAYYLEKVDSIRIDRENRVRVLDFNPVSKRFLAFDQITQEFLLLDERGLVLEAVYRVGEGPNEYNSNLLAASFNHERGGYYTLSSRDFLWFNENWEVEKRLRFAPQFFIRFYSGPRFKVPYYTLPGDLEPYLFTNFFTSTNTGVIGEEGDITSEYLIELYNPQKDSLEWVLPNDPQLLPEFELDKENRQTKPVPLFVLDNEAKLMYLTFQRSGEIGVYDLAKGFALNEKVSFGGEDLIQSHNSRNTGLFHFSDGTLGILYFQGLSDAGVQTRRNSNPEYSAYSDPSLYRLILIGDGMQRGNGIGFPASCEPHSEIVQLPGNRILLRDRYMEDNEPEYSTYSIFQLKFR
ncbi:MAG TPA: hypothetical protein VKZ51_03015 [Cyclobacteriaceae bacterium]|nr:hypothetical protein [Cyclobacteriaceae bacterium]